MAREIDQVAPVQVEIVGSDTDKAYCPELSAFSNWQLLGTEPVFQLLPQDARRHKATIACYGSTQGDTPPYVLLGKREQVMNGQGFILPTYEDLKIESQAEVWCAPAGQAVTVCVLDERYLS